MGDQRRHMIGGQLEVLRLGLGGNRITGPGGWGEPTDRAGAVRMLRRAVELGIDLIDTADAYGPFVSEELIAEALYPYPDNLVIATKGGATRSGPGAWATVGRPEYLRQCVEMSLRRLRRECIDLYQLHGPDPKVPIAESAGALKELQDAGKIRFVGLSTVTVEELAQAREVIEIVTVQRRYNLADRTAEPVLEACARDGIGFIAATPFDRGDLAQPGGTLDAFAAAHDTTVTRLSLAWLLHRSPVVLAIPGTSKVRHLEDNLAALDLSLTDEEWKSLEHVAPAASAT